MHIWCMWILLIHFNLLSIHILLTFFAVFFFLKYIFLLFIFHFVYLLLVTILSAFLFFIFSSYFYWFMQIMHTTLNVIIIVDLYNACMHLRQKSKEECLMVIKLDHLFSGPDVWVLMPAIKRNKSIFITLFLRETLYFYSLLDSMLECVTVAFRLWPKTNERMHLQAVHHMHFVVPWQSKNNFKILVTPKYEKVDLINVFSRSSLKWFTRC